MPGERLDLSSDGPDRDAPATGPGGFLGVNFACCGVYARVYPNRDKTAYEGRCPKCLRSVRFLIGPGGATDRFFTAS